LTARLVIIKYNEKGTPPDSIVPNVAMLFCSSSIEQSKLIYIAPYVASESEVGLGRMFTFAVREQIDVRITTL